MNLMQLVLFKYPLKYDYLLPVSLQYIVQNDTVIIYSYLIPSSLFSHPIIFLALTYFVKYNI